MPLSLPDLPPRGKVTRFSGWIGASYALHLARLTRGHDKSLLLITPTEIDAQNAVSDLRFFLPQKISVHQMPCLEVRPYSALSAHADLLMDRLEILSLMSQASQPLVVVASVEAMARRVMPATVLRKRTLTIAKEDEHDRDKLITELVALGYQRVPLVEDRGTFAVRGGILDVYPASHDWPARLEFFGDLIESIREFDPTSQKGARELTGLNLVPVRETLATFLPPQWQTTFKKWGDEADIPRNERDKIAAMMGRDTVFPGLESFLPLYFETLHSLFDYLPAESLIAYADRASCRAQLEELHRELKASHDTATSLERIFRPEALLMLPAELEEFESYFPALDFSETGTSEPVTATMEANTALHHRIEADWKSEDALAPLIAEINEKRLGNTTIHLVAAARAQRERLKDLLTRHHVPVEQHEDAAEVETRLEPVLRGSASPASIVTILPGQLSEGFYWPEENQWWLTDEEIFGKKARRAKTSRPAGEAFSSFSELRPADYVVHEHHGIGIYRELVTLTIGNTTNDFLLLEYLGGDKLYVPVDQLGRISRYSSQEGVVPLLDKMGGATWLKVRERVKRATRRLAGELLKLQAVRESQKGFVFSQTGELFEEFEAAFPFEETEDQLKAIIDVMKDMEGDKPMDRVVCGDVGYGKTEVAMRAAFRACLDHKQVAVLVPTTVLAFQHGETFKRRFKDFPVTVEILSRFQTATEQKRILKDLGEGKIDIIIGTHRLLSGDVTFRDLGLLVVDEEHRFGVAHKERIKKLKNLVPILTLTATPIPRTLNFALTGIRDLSVINTPPADRLAIRTFMTHFEDGAIREAALKEIKRGGQIYFVHNRVQSIEGIHDRLKQILPEVSIAVAHGQMEETRLEKVMLDFMEHKFNILLCTTIIESGLDIPAANTIFINQADKLGLAQLYQLRGRVGRSRERAYCYLLIPEGEPVTDDARKRLAVITRFTELGSGFKIASHDLEIRGAGNILGAEQSGQIGAVGYEMYVKLLEEAVNDLKGAAATAAPDTEMKLPVSAFIPDQFVADTQLRLMLYKQISSLKTPQEIPELREEWIDRFGPLPDATENLVALMTLKVRAGALGIAGISTQGGAVVYQIAPACKIPTDFFVHCVKKDAKTYKLLPDGKFVISGKFQMDRAILETVGKHLTDMERAAG